MAEGALSSLRVLDLTQSIAGPYCTKLMAAMGAEVIKIENPEGGDPSRRMGPYPGDVPDPEKSGLFLYLNNAKKSITLNLRSETGQKIFLELLKDMDVLVENFEPWVMPSWGLDYELLSKINPKLVLTSISNYGQTGPYRDYKAHEINVVALAGLMYMTGDPDREPLKEAGFTAQLTAGANACAATLSATFVQKRDGVGQHVDVSIMEAAVSLLDTHTMTWSRTRIPLKRNGNYSRARPYPGGAADSGVYPTKDGYIGAIFSGASEIQMGAALTGNEEFLDPEIGYMGFGRVIDDDKLNKLLSESFLERDKEEVYHSAQELRLFWGAVRNVKEVMESQHYQDRGFWTEIDHPKAGKFTYCRPPFIMSETETFVARAPLFGEHNQEIYDRLGYSAQDLIKLRETNVI